MLVVMGCDISTKPLPQGILK